MINLFWENIVTLNLNSFENIGINFYINIFLFFVAIVFCLFALYIEQTRGIIQLFISQLKRHKATAPEDAKTLKSLGLDSKWMLKRIIKNNRMLSRIVGRTEQKQYTPEEYMLLKRADRKNAEKIDFNTEKFYILPESSSRADDIYANYGFSLGRFVVFCIFIMIIYVVIAVLSPEIIRAIDNAIGENKGPDLSDYYYEQIK